MLRPNYTKDLDLFRACSSYFLSRPAAIEIGRRVEHNHNIRINEPMPKHILERIAGPNVVRVQEYVESAGRKEIVKLQRSCPGFHPPIAHKNPRSEEHTSELQSLMRNSYAVICLKK